MSNYTKIPNDLLDNMADLTPAQFKLAMAMHRLTTGWQRQSAKATISELSRLTGLSRRGVKLAIPGINHLFSYADGVVLSTMQGGTEYQGGGTEYQLDGTQLPDLHLAKERKEILKEKKEIDPLLELVNHFADTAGVKKPNGIPNRDKWLDPLVSIYHAAHDDYAVTKTLITDTVRFLKDKGYTVVNPASIVKTATTAEFVTDSRGVSDV